MSSFKYSKEEENLNKVLKMNQDFSTQLKGDTQVNAARKEADANIETSLELLKALKRDLSVDSLINEINESKWDGKLKHRPRLEAWSKIVQQADKYCPVPVSLEDIMSESEIDAAFQELDAINDEFSRKTSLFNETDLSFLAIATALQVTKSLVFPYIAEKFHYGESFDQTKRLAHDDKSIEQAHKKANNNFRDKYIEKHGTGYWINILYQTPAYDITSGSADLAINMGGKYHRMHTLGHDPILGWLFGTMNILTDVITLNNFQSYRVVRKPKMKITGETVPLGIMVQESNQLINEDFLNLPAAIFAQAQHLKSDVYTKVGLPVPLLAGFDENFASKLYKSQYDALCFSRDAKITGISFIVSKIIDMIISLTHGLFRIDNEERDIYEVRTRKILMISSTIASSSSIINAWVYSNPKKLDIGSLLNTVLHLFTDIRFIAKIKEEFVEGEISNRLQAELKDVDNLFEIV